MIEDGKVRLAHDGQAASDFDTDTAEQDLGTVAVEQSAYKEAEGFYFGSEIGRQRERD